jgi:uncharacterized membrane protein
MQVSGDGTKNWHCIVGIVGKHYYCRVTMIVLIAIVISIVFVFVQCVVCTSVNVSCIAS